MADKSDAKDRALRENLRAWMKNTLAERSWTPEEWARRAETSATNITRFLNQPDASMPTTTTLGRLIEAAGTMPVFGRPVDSPSVRTVRFLSGRVLFRVAQAIRRNLGAEVMELAVLEDRVVAVEESTPKNAFALTIDQNTLNVAGILAGDTAVVEPATSTPPKNGDPVAVLIGEKVAAYHYHPPYLIPRSTDAKAQPLALDAGIVLGAIRSIVRKIS